MTKRLLAVMATLLLFVLAACGTDDGNEDNDTASGGSETTAESGSAESECTYTEDGTTPAKDVELPSDAPSENGNVPATIKTNRGDIKITLDAKNAPCTVNSFLSLAEQDYYAKTPCHRLTTAGIFVLQCGDPSGTGAGGPGYTFEDELKGSETYPAGTLAMANAGPDTNGSQFFLVYQDTPLPPSYTVFGKMNAAGIKTVEKIAAKGSDNANAEGDGSPNQPVQITAVVR